MSCRVLVRRAVEVTVEHRVHRVERGLHRGDRRGEDRPETGDDLDRVARGEDERLAAGAVDVPGQDLGLPVPPQDVADEQLVLLQRHLGRRPDVALGALAHDQLEGLVAAEVDLLRVAVRARVGAQPVEAEEDPEPPLLASDSHLGRDAREIDRAVHPLAGAEEDALTDAVVGAAGRGEVDGEVSDRRMRGRLGAADDAVDADVRGQVAVGLLEQLEAEVELGLGHALAEVVVQTIGHACSLGSRPFQRGKAGRCRNGDRVSAGPWTPPAR